LSFNQIKLSNELLESALSVFEPHRVMTVRTIERYKWML
jgi:hypothetical protein